MNGVVDVRYTGGARMLLLIEVGTGSWRIKIPVMVSGGAMQSAFYCLLYRRGAMWEGGAVCRRAWRPLPALLLSPGLCRRCCTDDSCCCCCCCRRRRCSAALLLLHVPLLSVVAYPLTPPPQSPFATDLDLEGKLWLKIRLAPMCPWIGTLGLGFVGAPNSAWGLHAVVSFCLRCLPCPAASAGNGPLHAPE